MDREREGWIQREMEGKGEGREENEGEIREKEGKGEGRGYN